MESVNGRLKNMFKFFDDTIPASYFPKLPKLLKVATAIINAFSPPLFVESDWHEEVVEHLLQRLNRPNTVQDKVEELSLKKKASISWKNVDEDELLEFPSLSLDELKQITLGPYQLNIGALYNSAKAPEGSGYSFQMHEELSGMLRLKLQSRFSKNKCHTVWIEFLPWGTGVEAITGWYCLCKNGARTLGCCGHVAAVSEIYYLFYLV